MPFLDPASNPACFINDFCGPDRRLKDAMRPPNCSFIEVAAGENSGSATDSFVFVMALREIAAGETLLLDYNDDRYWVQWRQRRDLVLQARAHLAHLRACLPRALARARRRARGAAAAARPDGSEGGAAVEGGGAAVEGGAAAEGSGAAADDNAAAEGGGATADDNAAAAEGQRDRRGRDRQRGGRGRDRR